MPAITEMAGAVGSSNDRSSAIDRVRVRMTRLMHPGRPAPAPRPMDLFELDQRSGSTAATAELPLASLAADVTALEQALQDCEEIVRQAWLVAADLNQVRRHCARCEEVGLLAEALGTFQGLLNRSRHNLRNAGKAVGNIKAVVITPPITPQV